MAWRRVALALGLVSLLAALAAPLTHKLFAAHMALHVVLLAVAPPLIVLSAPWARLWQSLPPRSRIRSSRGRSST